MKKLINLEVCTSRYYKADKKIFNIDLFLVVSIMKLQLITCCIFYLNDIFTELLTIFVSIFTEDSAKANFYL